MVLLHIFQPIRIVNSDRPLYKSGSVKPSVCVLLKVRNCIKVCVQVSWDTYTQNATSLLQSLGRCNGL